MPHIIVSTQNRIDTGPTYIGDERSDPELMLKLEAQKYQEPGNHLEVLDRLELLGFNVIGVAGIGQTWTWTLYKSPAINI